MTVPVKRYFLFGGSSYYPAGGWDDLIGRYDTLEEAREIRAAMPHVDWFQIIDMETGEEVE